MKRFIYFSAIILLISACKGKESNSASGNTLDSANVKSSTTEYTCPMHPEVVSKEAGKCPRCGMDLEVKS